VSRLTVTRRRSLVRFTPAEVKSRGQALLRQVLDRAGLLNRSAEPGDASMLRPLALQHLSSSSERIRLRSLPSSAALLSQAEGITLGAIPVLGLGPVAWGVPPGWHVDPIAGCTAPEGHWTRIPFLDEAIVGDHKVTWELNRMQWLVTLAQAATLRGDQSYVEEIESRLSDWEQRNPPRMGINWASALEVAFRSISIAWCWSILTHGVGSTQSLDKLVARLLADGARYIQENLSTYFSPNTHLTGEALGLLYIASVLPGHPRAATWADVGATVFDREMERQLHRDGSHFEQALWYHQYTVEFCLHRGWLGEGLNRPPAWPAAKVRRAAELLACVLRPDGSLPLFGDDDGGRTLRLTPSSLVDFRDTVFLAALDLGLPELFSVAPTCPDAAIWWRGFDRCAAVRPGAEARAGGTDGWRYFPAGGWFVLRDRSGEHASRLVVDLGPHGALNCGHGHADAMSFELQVGDTPVICDPGTYRYVGAERNRWRHATNHSVITLDGDGPCEPGTPFRWERIPTTSVRSVASRAGVTAVEADVVGWHGALRSARHSRAFIRREGEYWLILDRVDSVCAAAAVGRLHFAAGLDLRLRPSGLDVETPEGDAVVAIELALAAGVLDLRVEDCQTSKGYGQSAPSRTLAYAFESPNLVATVVASGAARPRVRVERHGDGALAIVELDGRREMFSWMSVPDPDMVVITPSLAWCRHLDDWRTIPSDADVTSFHHTQG
jgi:hypothetical protein